MQPFLHIMMQSELSLKKTWLWKHNLQTRKFFLFPHLSELIAGNNDFEQYGADMMEIVSTMVDNFQTMKLEEFWLKNIPIYPKLGEEALLVDSLFINLFLQSGFFNSCCIENKTVKSSARRKWRVVSQLVVLKIEHRYRQLVKSNELCAVLFEI